MSAKKDQNRKELENEVARLRELSVKSTDPLTVAKAIAASEPAVQDLILARLDAGESLVEVYAFPPKTGAEVRVFFRCVPASHSVHMVDSGILVFVDYARGAVMGTVDPYLLQPEQFAARPFVAIAPMKTLKYAAGEEASKALTDRQAAFFQQLGLVALVRGDGWGGIATVRDTRVTTHTWSAGRSDDTEIEYTDDYVDCEAGMLA